MKKLVSLIIIIIGFAGIIGGCITKSSKFAITNITITPEREVSVDFTKPLYKETETVIVPKYSDINNKSDLKELVIGVGRGTIFVDLAQEWKKNNFIKDVMIFESTTDLLNAINLRKVDAGIADSIVVNSFLADGGSYLPLRTLKDYTAEVNGTLGMAVRKADRSLLNEVNKAIDDMKADGTLYAILVDNGLNRDNIVPQ
jgi:polar amino acid transport system substrate-binding protein